MPCKISKFAEEHQAVSLFRDYLRIKSVQPHPDYDSCIKFLIVQANRLGLGILEDLGLMLN
jgi:hypothetical protein